MPSAFAFAGLRLRDNGVSVLPIMPGAKAPGTITGGQWRLEHGWSRFCDRKPTDLEMGIWERWPDAGVGAALGSASGVKGLHLVAADVDTEDATIAAAILRTFPPSPVRKKGLKGQTLFFLAPASVVNQSFNGPNKERWLDLLASGRQTVLPPTMHPDCAHCGAKASVITETRVCRSCGCEGVSYHWLTDDTLEDFDLADLPVLPEDIGSRLETALAPFGYTAPLPHGEAGTATLEGESIHRSLNDAALVNLDSWVPALQLFGCTRSGGHYRAVASWRPSASGRPLSQRSANLSIAPEGIKDFGDCDRGYTPLDLVMAACGADLDTAFRWLQDHVAPQKPVLLTVTAPKQVTDESVPASAKKVGNLAILGGALPAPTAYEADVIEMPADDREVVDGVIPDAACFPPGILGEIVDWIVQSADTPSPPLALGAALNLFGALIGRRFEGPTRARSNFYGVGVAPTGYGKNHALTCCSELAYAAGLHKFLGPEDVKSDSAIRKMLEAKPSVAVYMDEFGGYMGKILDRRAAAHDKRSRDMLLTLFSRANGTYHGSEGATEKAVPIINPNLCVHGVSTPSDLWKAFSSASAEDGLLPRFLIFDAGMNRPEIVEPSADPSVPPMALVSRLRALMDVRPKGNLNGIAGQPNKPIRAAWGPDADAWFHAYRTFKRDEAMSSGGMREIVASREAEHVVKLALCYAVGCEPQTPVITVAALEWAREIVTCSATALLTALDSRVADSDKQAEYLWVLRQVREAGAFGIPESVLMKMVRGRFDKRRFDDILGQLMAANEVTRGIGSGPKGGRPSTRLFPMAAQVDEAA